jgi:hypothetical protein
MIGITSAIVRTSMIIMLNISTMSLASSRSEGCSCCRACSIFRGTSDDYGSFAAVALVPPEKV